MKGNRAALPADAMKRCPACGTARGTVKKDWTAIHQDGGIVGFTCTQCPTWTEPIRRETSRAGVRFVAVVAGRVAGKRRQLKRRFDTLEGARAWVEEMRGLAATGQAGDPSLLTVREVRALDGAPRGGGLNPRRTAPQLAGGLPVDTREPASADR
ncbi:hypothetical protein [Tessaracoccus flavus]|nr:hypothetical protein [Tessaracoccus flavus]